MNRVNGLNRIDVCIYISRSLSHKLLSRMEIEKKKIIAGTSCGNHQAQKDTVPTKSQSVRFPL